MFRVMVQRPATATATAGTPLRLQYISKNARRSLQNLSYREKEKHAGAHIRRTRCHPQACVQSPLPWVYSTARPSASQTPTDVVAENHRASRTVSRAPRAHRKPPAQVRRPPWMHIAGAPPSSSSSPPRCVRAAQEGHISTASHDVLACWRRGEAQEDGDGAGAPTHRGFLNIMRAQRQTRTDAQTQAQKAEGRRQKLHGPRWDPGSRTGGRASASRCARAGSSRSRYSACAR
ncbi:hypothetical protein C2E23DRAFT_51102 [Lenzites betulinus]|nr:hypothetical protein C2E23DRAFT_51102 [Lenzites betulinus]